MRYHLDEHVPTAIATGLRRSGIDVTTTSDASLISTPDIDHLIYAHLVGRVVVTQDTDFLRIASSGISHAGIVYAAQGTSIGRLVEYLELMHRCMSDHEMLQKIEYL